MCARADNMQIKDKNVNTRMREHKKWKWQFILRSDTYPTMILDLVVNRDKWISEADIQI